MKKVLLFSIVYLILVFSAVAQTTPAILWQKSLGGNKIGYVINILPTKDGGYIAVGSVDSTNGKFMTNYHSNNDVWVAKLDSFFNIKWQKCYGGSKNEWGYKVVQSNDGGYIIAGETGSNDGDVSGNHGGGDIWIFKIDSTGNLLWQKCFGGTMEDIPNSIIQTNDGGYVVAGRTLSNDGDVTGFHQVGLSLNNDGWILKMDSAGNLQWQKCLGGSDDDGMEDILENDDGTYMVAGYTLSDNGDVTGNHGNGDAWVVKLNNIGSILWQKCYGGTDDDGVNNILKTSDHGFILGGGTSSIDGNVNGNHGSGDDWVVKIDSIGNLLWQKCLGGSGLENYCTIQKINNNGFVIGGTTQSNNGDVTGNHGSDDYWIVNLDSIGNILWQKCLGGIYSDIVYNIYQTNDGGFILSGYSNSPISGDITTRFDSSIAIDDWWIVKLTSEILPLSLLSFKATPNTINNGLMNVQLNWITADELNVSHFNVQRSIDGKMFEKIGSVNSKGDGNYIYLDFLFYQHPFQKELYFYRLEIVDNEGGKSYSDIRSIMIKNTNSKIINIYPNPSTYWIVIEADNIKQVDIINNLGKIVLHRNSNTSDISFRIDIHQLTRGIYNLQVKFIDGGIKTEKLFVE